ncbi:MAG: cation diffusion facilitator family transporter, partial [Spirochaetaceae bacterium]|nr:cation diffusion facilitator family transporter [Spirochaetaceae bacterium]
MAEESKTSYIRKASLIALVGNSVLAALKLIAGYVSGSLAVVGDGIDSIVDVAIAIMILFVSRFVAQPADKEHPWGHGRAETVASLVLACMLFFAGAELVRSSIVNLVQRPGRELPDIMAIIVTLVSIAGKTLLALSQKHYAKKAASPLLRANAKDMLADVLLSVGVLIGLVFSYVFRTSIIDTIAAILVGLWVIKSSIEVFTE